MKPFQLLDVCCAAGGCSRGFAQALDRAGIPYQITGVDIVSRPNYAKSATTTPHIFVQGDAVEFLASVKPGAYDFIHASPPCQAHSKLKGLASEEKQTYDIISPVRAQLERIGAPYMIENVPFAPIRPDVKLYGEMFPPLKVIRERWFELGNWWMMQPGKPLQIGKVGHELLSVVGNGGYRRNTKRKPGHSDVTHEAPFWSTGSATEDRKIAMGIDWMSSREIPLAIPPAYTDFLLTTFLLNHYGKQTLHR